jgi:DNA polymerase-3 subunit beta
MMRFECDRSELARAAAWAAAALPKRPAVPVLGGMRAEVAGGTLALAGFDYSMTARSIVPSDGTADGVALVNGAQLLAAVRSMPAGRGARVTGEVAGDVLTLTSGAVTASLPLADMSEYPALPYMPPAAGVVAAGDLDAAVGRVAVAAGRDDTLPVLTTIRVTFSDDSIGLAATDRYRAGADSVPFTPAGAGVAGRLACVPAKPLAAFTKAAGKDGEVTVYLGDPIGGGEGYGGAGPLAGFSDGARELVIYTSNGEFPRLDALWPASASRVAGVDAGALGAALKRAGQASEKYGAARLEFTASSVTVTAHRDGQVASTETVPCVTDAPASDNGPVLFAVAYNPAYMGGALAGVAGLARLAWPELHKPVMVTPADDSTGYRALVVPIRIAV